jgi:murein DD-endopeptidase MepM/ murein hydrolase activator NlpD/peptidoglycan hydrolase-like protein with peptidoglycan-binding domain
MSSRDEQFRDLRSYPRGDLESPFLEGELFVGEVEAEGEPRVRRFQPESPFQRAFEQGRTSLSEPEEPEEEFVEEEEQADADDYAFHQGDLSERGTFADYESWDPAATLEFEAAGCTGDHELLAFEGELLDSEIWQGAADQVAFRDRVLDAHIALSRKRAGAAKRDLSPKELGVVAGTNIEMGLEAAAAAGRLLAAANADLAKAQEAGHADALRTIRLSATSGYRDSAYQRKLWLRYFTAKGGYYDRTQTARGRLADGPHSEQAITYMLTPEKEGGFGLGGRIAAPGYSNHQGGIAIDFWQKRKKGHEILNNSGKKARAKWRSTWFHKWLRDNAANIFGFQPIPTEEWHWEYRRGSGTTASASAATSAGPSIVTPTALPAPSTAQPAAELVRFAQRVLNAAEGERLSDDGDLGRLTRAALERFRKKYGLGMGGGLDASTELALAQRALEELAQASMFAQLGTRDARTEQALITFKSTRQLGMDAKLDATTRRALTDALARRAPKPRASATAPQTPVSATPSTYLGGKLWTFEAKALPTRVAVFCPQAALSMREVEVLVYAHGLLNGCKRPKSIPDGMITDAPFKLGDIVAASGRPIVLVVPYLDWANPGGESAFGKERRKWHALGKPAHLNNLIAEVLAELGRVQSTATPSLRNLVIAGHSRAYDLLEPLAHSHSDPQMQQGALARLSQVWAFDSTYVGNVGKWMSWLDANPGLHVSVFYEPGSRTGTVGEAFYGRRSARLAVIRAWEGHCAVPARRLPALLKSPVAATDQETEAPWGEDELDRDEANLGGDDFAPEAFNDETPHGQNATDADFDRDFDGESDEAFEPAEEHHEVDRFDPLDERDADEQHLSAEHELDALAFEALGSDDERASDDEDEEFEFEDEDYADEILEEEASDKSPLPVPVGNPVPFSPLPPMGSYWPVRTSRKDARKVSYMYQAPSGIVGRAGRMFLAGRKGKRDGKQALRWHAGVDLFANIKDVVVACEDGTIVDFSFFYKAKSGQRTYKLLIQHDGSGVVVNNGEVTGDSLRKNGLKVGDRVAAGETIGFVSDTSMLHFETYIKGTTTSHRWWKAEKTPPRQLLNPTRYLLFLRKHGLASTQDAGTQPAPGQPAPTRPASTSTKTPAELVRFAQRVLNATEATRLDDDGDLGRLTRGALERFRKKYNLGAGGVLDDKTQLALAQRAIEEIAQQSIFAKPGVRDAKTEQVLITFKSDRGLGFNATLDAATRAALTDALSRRASAPSGSVPVGALDRIIQAAAQSEIARYRWRDRGVAPPGYIKGMGLVYARVYCKLKAGDAAAAEMAKANTGNGERDALAHYAQEFNAVGMDNESAGTDTLRHLFVLLIGLGMRESSGRYCAGRDRSASNTTADTAEAGLFQTSYNARKANRLMPQLFRHYLAKPSGFVEVFQEGVSCSSSNLENFGDGEGREFQRLSKTSPAFAAEFAAVGLRNSRKHWGPINRKAVEIRLECDAMLLQVQKAVDEFELCPVVQ